MDNSTGERDALQIFNSGLKAVDPEGIINKRVLLENSVLSVSDGSRTVTRNLNNYTSIYVTGAGKASAKMALALEKILRDRITRGLVVVKYGHTEKTERISLMEAAHPVPDDNSVAGADAVADICSAADEKSLIINLISGGGSALLCRPYTDERIQLSLEDKQETTRRLLACGAEIQEINCIRKHLSGMKGGRLARLMYPADSLNLILSDVVGDRLDAIASGMTVPDETTFDQALVIVNKYSLSDSLPPKVLQLLKEGARGELPDTPKPGDQSFQKVENIILGSNYQGLKAAEEEACKLGYNCAVLSSQITGEAKEAAKFYLGIGADVVKKSTLATLPACIIAGGETTVTIHGEGTGGRNQEMALAFLNELRNRMDIKNRIVFLSGATDGNDGPTDAAGGVISWDTVEKIGAVNVQQYLSDNNSYHCLDKLDALVKTGPTNTNVCDIQILLVY